MSEQDTREAERHDFVPDRTGFFCAECGRTIVAQEHNQPVPSSGETASRFVAGFEVGTERVRLHHIHCDHCGLTWLDDGLNPIGCPYCSLRVEHRASSGEAERLAAQCDALLRRMRKEAFAECTLAEEVEGTLREAAALLRQQAKELSK